MCNTILRMLFQASETTYLFCEIYDCLFKGIFLLEYSLRQTMIVPCLEYMRDILYIQMGQSLFDGESIFLVYKLK